MIWLKKVWKEKAGKGLLLGAVVGFPLFSLWSYWVTPSSDSWWQAWAFGWGFFFVILLVSYLMRNAK